MKRCCGCSIGPSGASDMEKTTLFWILMLLYVLSGIWGGIVTPPPSRLPFWGGSLLLFFILVVLGMKVFGDPIKG